ncbi:MAG: 50S ribosomal protein L10 [Candidatus Syntropharchaeia archaeon]
MRKIQEWKREKVEEIKTLKNAYRVLGIVGMRGIGARQLQEIRNELRKEDTILRMYRNTLIGIAFDEENGKLKEMKNYINDQTALIFTNINPFELYRILERSKTKAPIKPGWTAPEDIVVEKGPTNFKPGPIVGELQRVGIPAAIEGGKVVIRETKTVVKKGEVVSSKLADILKKLEIYPVEIGLNLSAVYEEGTIYKAEDLVIDESEYYSLFVSGVRNAYNLAVKIAYPAPETVGILLRKAWMDALNLCVNVPLFEPGSIKYVIARAHSMAVVLDKKLKGEKEKIPETKEKEEEKVEKEEVEEKKEEDAAVGLSALFG